MVGLSSYPGLAGLFVAGIFSGALSTVSSAVTSLAAVTLEDFVKPFCFGHRGLPDDKASRISKLLALFYGILCVILAYVAEHLGGILQASLTIFGVVGGPLLGVFSLGMLTRTANQKGALTGLLTSLVFGTWIGFGANLAQVPIPSLPRSQEGCSDNQTIFYNSSSPELNLENITALFTVSSPPEDRYIFPLYRLSYMWYAALGWLICFVVGLVISLIGGRKETTDPRLLSPVVNLWKVRRHHSLSQDEKVEICNDETKL